MHLNLAEQLAQDLMSIFGLDDWSFKFNNSKRMLGVCKEGKRTIELSSAYVRENSVEHVQDTILHEIAHALVGVQNGHNDVWKSMCRRIGASPKACDSTALLPKGPWQARCPGCFILFHRHRRPAKLNGLYCKKCGPWKGRLLFKKVITATFKPVEPAQSQRLKEPRQLTLPLSDLHS